MTAGFRLRSCGIMAQLAKMQRGCKGTLSRVFSPAETIDLACPKRCLSQPLYLSIDYRMLIMNA